MHLPFGAPATNRAEFRDCWVHKFITSVLWGHCHVENARWTAREKHPQKSIQLWVEMFERKIIRTEQLKKEKVTLHGTKCWVTSRALFGAHSSPWQEFMNSQGVPSACSSASCKDAHLQSRTLLAARRSSIFIKQKSPHFVLLLPAVQITHPQFYQSCHSLSQECWSSNAAALPALSWGICTARAQSWEPATALWAIQTENAGNTKGLISNLHIATYPRNRSLLKKELHEKGELKQAAARWEIYPKPSQEAYGSLQAHAFLLQPRTVIHSTALKQKCQAQRFKEIIQWRLRD